MHRPGKRLYYLLGLGACASLAAPFDPGILLILVAYDCLLACLAIYEARKLKKIAQSIDIQTTFPSHAFANNTQQFSIFLRNHSPHNSKASIRFEWPTTIQEAAQSQLFKIAANASFKLNRHFIAKKRGLYPVGDIWLTVFGSSGLMQYVHNIPLQQNIKIMPNISFIPHTKALLLHKQRLQEGKFKLKQKGEGNEFHRLREYVHQDPYHRIAWKASAKKMRPIVKEFQPEKNQQIIICLDISRSMNRSIAGLNKLETAIQAALLSAHTAIQQSDRVGMILFADGIIHYLAPANHQHHYRNILDTLTITQSLPVNADFKALSGFVLRQIKRRAFIMILSDVTEEQSQISNSASLIALTNKHIVSFFSTKEIPLHRKKEAPVSNRSDVFMKLAALHLLSYQQDQLLRLHKAGLNVFETDPHEIPLQTVHHYLALKQQGKL